MGTPRRPEASGKQASGWWTGTPGQRFGAAVVLLVVLGSAVVLITPHEPLPLLLSVLAAVGLSAIYLGLGPSWLAGMLGQIASAVVLILQDGTFPGHLYALFSCANAGLLLLTGAFSRVRALQGVSERSPLFADLGSTMQALSLAVLDARTFESAAYHVAQTIRRIGGGETVVIYDVAGDSQELRILAAAGAPDGATALPRASDHTSAEWLTVRDGRGHHFEQEEKLLRPTFRITDQTRWKSGCTVPVRGSDGRVIGVLAIYSAKRKSCPRSTIALAEMAAQQLGLTWQKYLIERSLEEQVKLMRRVAEAISEGICVLDAEGRVTFVNSESERILGRPFATLCGRPFRDVVQIMGETPGAPSPRPFETILPHGTKGGEVQLLRPDGSPLAVTASAMRLTEASGRNMTVLTLRDMSELREAERAQETLLAELRTKEERTETFIRQLPIGVAIFDASSNRLIFSNDQRHRDFANVETRSATGHPQILHDGGQPYSEAELPFRRALSGEVVVNEDALAVRRSGERVALCINAAPVRDQAGEIAYAVETSIDLTRRRRMEEQLKTSEERLRLIMKATSDAVYDYDAHTHTLVWNEAMQPMFGEPYVPTPLPISWWEERIHPKDRPSVLETFQRSFSSGQTFWSEEYRFRRADGSYLAILDRGYIVHDESGRACRMVGAMADITERRRTEEEQRLLAHSAQVLGHGFDDRAALSALAELIVPQFADACIICLEEETGEHQVVAAVFEDPALSDAFARKLGPFASVPHHAIEIIRTRQVMGYPLVHPTPPHMRRVLDDQWRPWAELGVCALLSVPLPLGGRAIGTMTWLNSVGGQQFTGRDVSLAEDVARRAASVVENARLHQREQEATRTRERFLSVASHELRSPIAILQMHIQRSLTMLQRDEAKRPELSTYVQALKKAEAQSERLARLVTDLLDVSRMSQGRLRVEKEPLDFVALVHDVVERLTPEFIRAGCRISVDAPSSIEGIWDPLRMEQALTNLLGNAMKYGRGRPILLKLREDQGWLVFSVQDEGIGIDSAHLARLFQPFERAVSERSFSGAGLGLYITKQIVEAHAGTLSVESEAGVGTIFSVRVPVGMKPEEWHEGPASPTPLH